ncbi:MAG: hypothetical protein LBR38_05365 [Synergistaceae bacterium]|jgi:rod shape-determining protein MreD|nr:hypothetical protein [Synergistaceae bacterium]
MIYAVCWLAQDLLTVLTDGIMQIPELFLLSIVYGLLTDKMRDGIGAIWGAFFGGLLWDLRWVGMPGFFALANVCVVTGVIMFWNALPSSGRTAFVVFFVFWMSQLIPSAMYFALFVRAVNGARLFEMQQICAVSLACLLAFCFARSKNGANE